MAEPSPVTVQLVRAADPGARRTSRLGVGLLVSLVVGWPALRTALAGGDAFEASVVRFVLMVAVSVGGALSLGALYDHFTAANADRPPGADPAAVGPTSRQDRP